MAVTKKAQKASQLLRLFRYVVLFETLLRPATNSEVETASARLQGMV
jgi:hypothetical protein